MFSTVLKEITGNLGKRFILSVLFPCLVFSTLALSLSVIEQGLTPTYKRWSAQPTEIRATLILLFLAWVTFLAFVLANYLTLITQLYEGYWDNLPLLRRLGKRYKRQYQEELNYLDKDINALLAQDAYIHAEIAACQQALSALLPQHDSPEMEIRLSDLKQEREGVQRDLRKQYAKIYNFFPPPTRQELILPTRLGNILRSAEMYPYLRYNMDAVLLWPRLYALLPDSFSTALGEAGGNMDQMLIVSCLAYLFAVLGGGYLLLISGAWVHFLAVFWGGLLIGWLSYYSALQAALTYSQLIKAAFDLHRNTLRSALGIKAPASLAEERVLWRNVDQYLYRNTLEQPQAFQYATEAADKTPKDSKT